MALLPAEEYFETGYIEDGYVGGIADAQIVLTPYFAEGYVEAGYVSDAGIVVSLFADLTIAIQYAEAALSSTATVTAVIGKLQSSESTLNSSASSSASGSKTAGASSNVQSAFAQSATAYRIIEGAAAFSGVMSASMTAIAYKNHTASMDSAFTQTSDINYIAGAGGLLEYFAALDAQAAQTKGYNANLGAVFFASNNSAQLGTNIDANATLDAASFLTTSSSLSASATTLVISDPIELSVSTSIEANPIEYILRGTVSTPGQRPLVPVISTATFTPSNKKFGSYAGVFDSLDNRQLVYHDNTLSPNNNEEWFFETWFWRGIDVTNRDILRLDEVGNTDQNSHSIRLFEVNYLTNNVLFIFVKNQDTGLNISATPYDYKLPINQWSHLLLSWKPGSGLKLYVNGSKAISVEQDFPILTTSNTRLTLGAWLPDNQNGGDSYLLDDTRIVSGSNVLSTYGYTWTNDTLTVPTTQFTNTTDTKLLLHYENSFRDDDSGLQLFTSNISSNASISPAVSVLFESSANISSTATVSATIGKIQTASSNFDAVASQLTAVGKIGSFFVNADIAAGLSIQEDLFKSYSADLNSAFTQTTSPVKTVDATINLNGAFSPTLSTDRVRYAGANLVSTATVNATGTRYQPGAADLSANAAVDAAGYVIVDGVGTFNAVATQLDTDFIRYRDVDANLQMTGAELTVVSKIAGFFINADITASLEATGVVKTGTVVEELANTVAMTVSVDRIRHADSALSTSATTEAIGYIVVDADAQLNGVFDQTVAAARTRGVETAFDSIATQLSAVGKIAPYTAGLDSSFAITASVGKITQGNIAVSANATVDFTPTRIKPLSSNLTSSTAISATLNKTTTFAADLNTTATVTAAGAIKVFNLQQYYYTIPAETRTHTIQRETRSHAITQETRTYTIEGS